MCLNISEESKSNKRTQSQYFRYYLAVEEALRKDAVLAKVWAHSSIVVAVKIHELKLEFRPHGPYSPELAPID